MVWAAGTPPQALRKAWAPPGPGVRDSGVLGQEDGPSSRREGVWSRSPKCAVPADPRRHDRLHGGTRPRYPRPAGGSGPRRRH